MNRGKIVILFMLGVAVCAAAFAAWYQYRGQNHAHEFWGTTSALLISEGPAVEVLLLGEPVPADQWEEENGGGESSDVDPNAPRAVEFGDRAWPVSEAKGATGAPGIQNIRKALVQNTTFDWRSAGSGEEPDWQYALGFTHKRNWATVLFDFETGQVALTGGQKTARLDPAAASDLRQFFAEQFPEQPASEVPAENGVENPSAPSADTPTEKPPEKSADEPATPPEDSADSSREKP